MESQFKPLLCRHANAVAYGWWSFTILFILLLVFYYSTKVTIGVLLAFLSTGFNRPAKFLILLKH